MIIGQKSMEIDIGRQYVSNYCPKSKKLIPLPPKPLNIDIGQSFPTEYLRKLTKVMLLWPDFFLNFQWIHWSEMTVLYLYLVVWGVTDWSFSISGSNCSHTVVSCHFPCLPNYHTPLWWVRIPNKDLTMGIMITTDSPVVEVVDKKVNNDEID